MKNEHSDGTQYAADMEQYIDKLATAYANEQMQCFKCSDALAPCHNGKCVNWHRCYKGFFRGYDQSQQWIEVGARDPQVIQMLKKAPATRILTLYEDGVIRRYNEPTRDMMLITHFKII